MTSWTNWYTMKGMFLKPDSKLWEAKRVTAYWIRDNWADLEEREKRLLWCYKQHLVEKTPYKLYCLLVYGSATEERRVFEAISMITKNVREAIARLPIFP